MATLVGLEVTIVDTLNNLIELDFDAIEAYRLAIARLHGAPDKQVLTAFMRDHQHHVIDLGAHVYQLGAVPASRPGIKAALTRGKVMLGALLGDMSILLAIRSTGKDTHVAYQRVNRRAGVDSALRRVLHEALLDERRHAAWLDHRLGLDGHWLNP
jgi:hypothetical protein